MKKIWLWITLILLLIYLTIKGIFSGRTIYKYIDDVQKAREKNNEKIKNLRGKKVNAKHFTDMSNKSLVGTFRRLNNKRNNKPK